MLATIPISIVGMHSRRKALQEFLKRRPELQIVTQRLKRNLRPGEDRSATHYFGVIDNCGTLDHRIK
jgi:hypothetical protein